MTEVDGEQPERTCVGCRQSAEKDELERFIYHEEVGLVYDLRKKAPGRGAYVHPRAECLERACQKGGFSRAFKTGVSVDPAQILDDVQVGIHRRLTESLRIAFRSQNLFIGGMAVAEAVKAGPVGLVVLARDASESTRQKFASNAERKGIPVREALSGEELGALCGRAFVALVAVAPARCLASIRRDIDRLEQLGAF